MQCRREIEHVLGNEPKGSGRLLISRAVTKAQDAFLKVDRSVRTSEIEAPDALAFVVPDWCVARRLNDPVRRRQRRQDLPADEMALAVSRGDSFLGRPTLRRNVLYIDCETGKTYGYRMRRLCAGEGLTRPRSGSRRPLLVGGGHPVRGSGRGDQALLRENEIGLHLPRSHRGGLRRRRQRAVHRQPVRRALGKIGLPMLALAHITGPQPAIPSWPNAHSGATSKKWMEATRPQEVEVRYIRTKNSGPLADWMRENAGHGALTKRIPDAVWELSSGLKRTLLEALIDGDGHRRPTGISTYHTISPQLANDVMRLAIELGHSASIRKDKPGRVGVHERYEVKIGRQDRATVVLRAERHITPEPYDGTVYCFTVATDAYLTRRNGKPFISGNSVYWHNNARRTVFVLRQQEAESPVADLGIYPRKVNDGSRPAPFGVRVTFDDPSGPIAVDASDLRSNRVLREVQGIEHVIWDVLSTPMTADDIADAVGKSERTCKDAMKAHPRMFTEVSGHAYGGRGKRPVWARVDTRMPYTDAVADDDYSETEIPF
jgi:hypothetical protein